MNKGETQTTEPKDDEIDDYAQGFTLERWHKLCFQEKKVEEDSPARRIALMHQYKVSRGTLERAKKDNLQQPLTVIAAKKQTQTRK